MEHFYKDIEGWFSFKNLYDRAINKANKNAHFVEVGAWLGCSTSYMAVEIINSGKNIKFDVVDTWKGSEEAIFENAFKKYGITPYGQFIKNMYSVIHIINPIVMSSVEAARRYEDESLDFVYIDADHSYNAIKADIAAWLPKVKQGGILGGHDYSKLFPGVVKAVREKFKNFHIEEISWWIRKSKFSIKVL